jgi:hypothetical protein
MRAGQDYLFVITLFGFWHSIPCIFRLPRDKISPFCYCTSRESVMKPHIIEFIEVEMPFTSHKSFCEAVRVQPEYNECYLKANRST